jgi:hypothetical protein
MAAIDESLSVNDALYAESFSLINKSGVSNNIPARDVNGNYRFGTKQNSTAAAETKLCHIAEAAGTIKAVNIAVVTAPVGDSTVTIDVKKNGTSILSSTKEINSTHSAYTPVEATLDGTKVDYSDGDCFTIVVTVSTGSGPLPTGLCVQVSTNENYPHTT